MAKLRFFIGIVISLLFLYLAVRNVDFHLVAASFRDIDYGYVALCIACQFASLFCRAYLWKNILSFEKNVRYAHSFEALIIGYMGNNVLPLRMGEAMRAYAMGMKEKISRTLSFASIILERLIDIFVLLLFFLALLLVMELEEWVVYSGAVVFVLFVSTLVFLYALVSNFMSLPSRVYNVVRKYVPARLVATADRIVHSFGKGLKLIRSLRQMVWLVCLSFLSWVLWTAILYYGFGVFHLDLPISAALLLSVVINIGVMIPSSPGFIGIFQYLCIVSLAFFNVPKETALSFSVIVHAIQYVSTTLLGWFYLTRMHIHSYQSLKRELEKAEL